MTFDLIALPKAEVHIHLEGCFEPDEIISLAEAYGVPLPRHREALYETSGLSDFLKFLDWTCGLVQTREQLSAAAYRFSERMRQSGIRYADVIVNPTHWAAWRKRIPEMLDTLDAAFKEAEQDGCPPSGLCISLLRQQTSEEAIELVEMLGALRHPRVIALSVDGNEAEAGRTGPRFAEAYRRAAMVGLRRTAHAGESSGPDGVRDALELLGAERIDHGVRAHEDPDLIKILVDRQIPLGITPTSNLLAGLYKDYADHPIEDLRKAGVPVSVNTDDPAILAVSLPEEYARLASTHNWDKETVRELARTSITASFATPELKTAILADLQAW